MYKYVADKIDSNNKNSCQCFHYVLKDERRESFDIADNQKWCYTIPHTFQGKEVGIRFQLLEVHMYCFSTTVGMVAFRIHLESNDPFWIAHSQYYLKKVSREKIFMNSDRESTTMLELSQ